MRNEQKVEIKLSLLKFIVQKAPSSIPKDHNKDNEEIKIDNRLLKEKTKNDNKFLLEESKTDNRSLWYETKIDNGFLEENFKRV